MGGWLDVSGSAVGTVADASDRMEHRPVACASDESAAKRVKLEHEPASSPTTATPARPAGVGALSSREKLHAVERDYTHYFALDVGGETGADQFVFQHFNTLCMVGIAPSSSAFAGRKVSQVDFDVGRGGVTTSGSGKTLLLKFANDANIAFNVSNRKLYTNRK